MQDIGMRRGGAKRSRERCLLMTRPAGQRRDGTVPQTPRRFTSRRGPIDASNRHLRLFGIDRYSRAVRPVDTNAGPLALGAHGSGPSGIKCGPSRQALCGASKE